MPLSILIWLPAAAALLGAVAGPRLGRWVTVAGALGALGIAIGLLTEARGGAGLRHVTDQMWISALGIHYKLGVDGLNVVLIVLATFVFAAALTAAAFRDWKNPGQFFFFALAESGVLGALCAQDLALFVLFFDLMLLPFYFLSGIWGGTDRIAATTKLVIYTLVGSLLMLAAAIALGVIAKAGPDGSISFAFSDLQAHLVGKGTQEWIFLCFAAAFLVKMPLFPFHGWMPDGYRAMPIEVLAAFSGVLSKVGAYGFLKVCLPLFPDASAHFQTLMLLIALASILYGSAMAFTTTNARLVAGYSSVAQMGFITLGIFSLRDPGVQGALLQMVNHGIVVAPLLLIVGLCAARAGGSEDIRDMGGIAFRAPVLAAVFLIVALANLAMPGSSNFVGEFLILLGVFQSKVVFAIIAFTGVALAAVYTLRAFIRIMHNRAGPHVESRELSLRDGVVLVPLTLVILAMAVYPQLALHRGEPSVKAAVAPARAAAHGVEAADACTGWTCYAPLSAGTHNRVYTYADATP